MTDCKHERRATELVEIDGETGRGGSAEYERVELPKCADCGATLNAAETAAFVLTSEGFSDAPFVPVGKVFTDDWKRITDGTAPGVAFVTKAMQAREAQLLERIESLKDTLKDALKIASAEWLAKHDAEVRAKALDQNAELRAEVAKKDARIAATVVRLEGLLTTPCASQDFLYGVRRCIERVASEPTSTPVDGVAP